MIRIILLALCVPALSFAEAKPLKSHMLDKQSSYLQLEELFLENFKKQGNQQKSLDYLLKSAQDLDSVIKAYLKKGGASYEDFIKLRSLEKAFSYFKNYKKLNKLTASCESLAVKIGQDYIGYYREKETLDEGEAQKVDFSDQPLAMKIQESFCKKEASQK